MFPDQATADRFLDHAIVNSFNQWGEFPVDWTSVDGGGELSGMIGTVIGARSAKDRLQVFGVNASGDDARGARFANGTITL